MLFVNYQSGIKFLFLKKNPQSLPLRACAFPRELSMRKKNYVPQRTAPPLSELTTGLTVTHLRNTIESKISITRYTYIIFNHPVLPQKYQPVIKQVCNKDTVTIKYV